MKLSDEVLGEAFCSSYIFSLPNRLEKYPTKKRQSCVPMLKPHDYVVLAVISTAHLRDNRICCLLYLPRGN